MTLTQWFYFFLIVQVVHFLGTWKLYVKAGRKAWEAAVPVYNALVLMKIINRPKEWYWVILLFIPVVNLLIFPVLWVETIRSFGRSSRQESILAIVTLGFYIYYVNYMLDVEYVVDRNTDPRSNTGEWVSSILFAVVAATLVHTYVMQPFVIPSSSLEKTLLVGDFLFVSKFHYGARTPMTTVSVPMIHDAIPLTGIKSYLSGPQLPYYRFPGFQEIKRNDIVVFNWPADNRIDINDASKGIRIKPLDKKSNYVKRCVGVPGDKLEIKEGYVYINGVQNKLPGRAKVQFARNVDVSASVNPNSLPKIMYERYKITDPIQRIGEKRYVFYSVTNDVAEQLKNRHDVEGVSRAYRYLDGEREESIFPHSDEYAWNNNFFGPIDIPGVGETVALTLSNLPLYKKIITEYEGNTLSVAGNQIKINGEVADSYTFKQNYYWMMGDNRDNSQDSRTWGFVPFDHVLGKPVFVWFSWDSNASGFNKIRWDRLFTTVGGEDKPVSYFKYFLIGMFGVIGFNYFRNRKKKKA